MDDVPVVRRTLLLTNGASLDVFLVPGRVARSWCAECRLETVLSFGVWMMCEDRISDGPAFRVSACEECEEDEDEL